VTTYFLAATLALIVAGVLLLIGWCILEIAGRTGQND
jgi:hypothetical protein